MFLLLLKFSKWKQVNLWPSLPTLVEVQEVQTMAVLLKRPSESMWITMNTRILKMKTLLDGERYLLIYGNK